MLITMANGELPKSIPLTQYAEGDFYQNAGTPVNIEVGFQPKVIFCCAYANTPFATDADGSCYWCNGASKVATKYNNSWQCGDLGSRFTINPNATGFTYTAYSGNTNRMKYACYG